MGSNIAAMSEDFRCNLCDSSKAHPIPFRYLFKNRYLQLLECDACGLRSIWPRPSDDEITEMYAADYFTGSDKETHHMEEEYVKILSAVDYTEGIADMKKRISFGSVLEIGCATGNFLHALKQHGFQVKGIELSAFAVNYAKEHFGLSLINQPFDDQLLNKDIHENEFDVIIMGDVLEHFTNPTAAMKLAQKILKPGGVLLIQVPGSLNLLSSKMAFTIYKLLGAQKTMTIPPYHLTEFTEKSIRSMCQTSGFSKTNISHHIKPPHTIPLRGTFIENFVKKSMQYPNYYLTKWFGMAGDRIHVEAYK